MPRNRLYTTDAERQQAYRVRRTQTEAAAIDTGPVATTTVANPWPRWRRLAGAAELTVSALIAEMQAYQQSRSERWQDSDRADEFADRLGDLAELHEQIRDWIASR